MIKIKHTESFDLAYRFVTETNLNIFLTGKAGTGKTTFLKYLRENSIKNMVVAAPTGVAAINAGGVTLHSLFQLPFAPFIPSKETNQSAVNVHSLLTQVRYQKEKLNLLRNLELLVIDEASMVASHTVDAIDTILKSVRKRHHVPFGGVQVLFIGDLYQLPPVVKNQEWSFLKNYYPSIFFFDSFVLRENIPIMIELKEIFRQQDMSFIDVLNEIRNNNLSGANYSLLNSRLRPDFSPGDDDGYITLTTHNYQSDEINKKKLRKLQAPSHIFTASVRGDFPEKLYPAEAELELKKGSQVMFLKNDLEGKKYFNGKIGVISELDEDTIFVNCKDEQEEIEVKIHEWKNINYSLNPETREIKEEELGSFRQYPLRLAWAITIHKSQGLTFDKLIIDAENAFANGQVYVALSRCTSLEGLILTSPVNQKFLGATQDLKNWQEKNHDDSNLKQKFDESRQRYAQQELQNIFTWKNWHDELRELNASLKEFKESLSPECFSWMTDLMKKQDALQDIAGKFKTQMAELLNQSSNMEENQNLQQRIKEGAVYFSSEILKWKMLFTLHPISTDMRKISRKVDGNLNETNSLIHETLHKINHCKNGFRLDDFLKHGKTFRGTIDKIQSSYQQSQTTVNNSPGITHQSLYNRLVEFRNHTGAESDQPLYLIFSNDAIKNVCEYLPLNKSDLLKIKGFGKVKVKIYGDDVIQIVSTFCRENNLTPDPVVFSKSDDEKQSVTVDETIKYFKQGKNIQEIAAERSLAISTIEGHFARAIKQDLVNIEELLPIDEVRKIASHFKPVDGKMEITALKKTLPESISYGQIRMVLAWWQNEKRWKK